MKTLRLLFQSRKFVVALGGIVLAVLTRVVGMDPEAADTLTYLIMALATAYILATGAEDAAKKLLETHKPDDGGEK